MTIMRSDNLSNLLFNLAQISGRHSRRVRRERKTFFFPGPGGGYSLKWPIHIAYIYYYFLPFALERLCFPFIHAHQKKNHPINMYSKSLSHRSLGVYKSVHTFLGMLA